MSDQIFKAAARDLLFGGLLNLPKLGLEYRTGKDESHIRKAREKARKNGQQKTEFELSMLECYLGDVLKVRK